MCALVTHLFEVQKPNPFAKVDAETEYLRNELAARDRTIKELQAKIALYEEYQRQKTCGLGLICADPRFGNDLLFDSLFLRAHVALASLKDPS